MIKLLFGALLLATALARPAAAQTRRMVLDYLLEVQPQAELALKNGDYVLLALDGQNVPAYNDSPYTNRFLGFDQRGAGLNYEHFWSEQWSGGAGLQLQSVAGYKYLIPELLLRHRSAVGPITFGQRLSASRVIGFGDMGRTVDREGQNFLALRADVEKLLPVGQGGVALRPRLSYEARMQVTLQKDKNAPARDERTIQHTSLRGEVGCRLGDRFDFTPWVAYTTAYYFALAQYNPVSGMPSAEAGRLNQVRAIFGFDARFTLFQDHAVFERKQLPTQH